MEDRVPKKVLFAHTPKAAGSHLIEYFRRVLQYPMIESDNKFDNGVWRDFTIDQLLESSEAEHAFICSHVLALGWSELVELIPFTGKDKIVEAIRIFRSKGWFTFTFVRHPGELLTSFFYYILDAHERGWHDSIALHTPAVGRTLEEFVSEHCGKELLPAYWREFDYADEASDANFRTFFGRYFDHEFKPGVTGRHASGSRGYAYYCETGELSQDTQNRIECSRNMEIYREILAARDLS
jgi:hypothetical protein